MTRGEDGAGLIASFLGALAFLAFLALATHALITLYATSVLTAVAWDEARRIAVAPGDPDAPTLAQQRIDEHVGFDDVRVSVQRNADGATGLSVDVARPVLLPKALTEATRLDRIERTVWVREEMLR